MFEPMIMTKSKRVSWAGRVGRMGEKRHRYTFRAGNPEGKDFCVDGNLLLNDVDWILISEYASEASSCENDSKPSR